MQRWTEMGRKEEHSKQLAWGKAEELTYPSPGQQTGANEVPGRE